MATQVLDVAAILLRFRRPAAELRQCPTCDSLAQSMTLTDRLDSVVVLALARDRGQGVSHGAEA